jgi:SAM-dependent methyltransferase
LPAATHWSQTYDNPGNPLIRLEQPVVWSILDAVAPGAALDAAFGTGRHARRLAELGHHVIGVDASSAMLEKARAALPQATFRDGDPARSRWSQPAPHTSRTPLVVLASSRATVISTATTSTHFTSPSW